MCFVLQTYDDHFTKMLQRFATTVTPPQKCNILNLCLSIILSRSPVILKILQQKLFVMKYKYFGLLLLVSVLILTGCRKQIPTIVQDTEVLSGPPPGGGTTPPPVIPPLTCLAPVLTSSLILTDRVGPNLDGPFSTASFTSAEDLVLHSAGYLYIIERVNRRIRKVDPIANTISTLYTFPSTSEIPNAIATDATGNIYVTTSANVVRKFNNLGSLLAVYGTPGVGGYADGATPRFRDPGGLAVDASGRIYVADRGNFRIRMISTTGLVTTLAGNPAGASYLDGPATSVRLRILKDLVVSSDGSTVYFSDYFALRRIYAGQINTIAGKLDLPVSPTHVDGYLGTSQFFYISSIAMDSWNRLYVTDGPPDGTPSILSRVEIGNPILGWNVKTLNGSLGNPLPAVSVNQSGSTIYYSQPSWSISRATVSCP